MHPLDEAHYAAALAMLEPMRINTLFARAVLGRSVPGRVHVDDADRPSAFHVVHPYGMSLLFGSSADTGFQQRLGAYLSNADGRRPGTEWLQADPDSGWSEWIDAFIEGHPSAPIERNTRLNYRLDPVAHRTALCAVPTDPRVTRTTAAHFRAHAGSVAPAAFWRDEAHFLRDGIGFTLLHDARPASIAFSAYRAPGQLEIGIETAPAHRGAGYAFLVGAALVGHCLAHGLEPLWACRLENTGSCRLAEKLGFREHIRLPYYRLG